jgi:hypothetical protein
VTAPTPSSCRRCGAILASDQQYCLECGTRRAPPRRRPWIAPLVAAVAVIAVGIALFAFSYAGVKDDANQAARTPDAADAGKSGQGRAAQGKSDEKAKRSSNSG